jgi:Peptidase family M23
VQPPPSGARKTSGLPTIHHEIGNLLVANRVTAGMRQYILFAAACLCSHPAVAQTQNRPQWPLQLEMQVPFEPTAFPSGSHVYLMYELHLTNFMPMPMSLSRIEVLDADAGTAQPVATFEAAQLESMLQPLGGKALSDPKDRLVIADGQSAIAFMCVVFDRGSHIPDRLLHRVTTAYAPEDGAVSSTHHTELHALGPPVEGTDWLASDGPSNDQDNHHRRGVVILDGRPVDSRRYAIDWEQVKDGVTFSGDARDTRSYYSYGKVVLAVADGRVIAARDGLPDNVPGHGDAFHPAVPISLETVAGNTITLDLDGGQFAYYMHLQPGSLRVKVGDRVRRGQVLARIGASGDAREPHLHFEVTTSSKLLAGEGVPYLIDRYSSKSTSDGPAELHTHDLPLDKNVVNFGEEPRE